MEQTLIEKSLDLEEIEENLFRSKTTWKPLGARGVFGGQVVGQSLAAAIKTVNPDLDVHSLHSYFLLPGDSTIPILYDVSRVRDGRSFATRIVKAIQKGKAIFMCTLSFHKRENFFLHHQWEMPEAPNPETLPSEKDIYLGLSEDPRFKKHQREWFKGLIEQPFPIDIRTCNSQDLINPEPVVPARQLVWMKSNGRLGDDLKLHQCVAAYCSDHRLIGTPLLPHALSFRHPRVNMMISLDHSMWFFEPFRADEWMLYEFESPKMSGNRGLSQGRIYTKEGKLAIVVAQEGLIRIDPPQNKL